MTSIRVLFQRLSSLFRKRRLERQLTRSYSSICNRKSMTSSRKV